MADRKRKRGVASTARGLLGFLSLVRRVRPRPPPSPPPSPSDSGSSSSSSEVAGTRPSYPRRLVRGTRSIKEPKPWVCEACGFRNLLIHHLLFDLPPFKCQSCDAEPPEGSTDFGFCFGNLALNGFCPIGNVKDQEGPTCMANALSAAVEITHRIMMIIREEPLSEEGPVVDVEDLLDKYRRRRKKEPDETHEERERYTTSSIFDMLHVLTEEGIKKMEGEGLYKIHNWCYIDKSDFSAISSALADGYPLLTAFRTGKGVDSLEVGDVYVPPKDNSVSRDGKTKPGCHMVVLVGAQKEGDLRFFYFLSSWSEDFCSIEFEGDGVLGGISSVVADGILYSPLQFLRFNERSEQEVHHPEYTSLLHW